MTFENERSKKDQSLAERLQRSDQSVLADMVNHLMPPIRARLRRRFGESLNEADWYDVMSAALYRLWASRKRFDPAKGSLTGWFYLIARSLVWDFLRKRSKLTIRSSGRLDELAAARPQDESRPPDSEDVQRLAVALEELADVDRRILLGFAARAGEQDWTSPLVAELGMPASTIRVRKFRAIAELRDLLRGGDNPFTTADPAMKVADIPQEYSDLVRSRWDEIENVGQKLRAFAERRAERQARGGLAQVEAEWNAAVNEHNELSQPNREEMVQTYSWLTNLAAPSLEHREKLGRFLKSLPISDLESSFDQRVGDLEEAFSTVTTKIELAMPDEVCRKGEGYVQLDYPNDDVSLRWQGDANGSALLLGKLVKRVLEPKSAFPNGEADMVAAQLVTQINAADELPLPNFYYPKKPETLPPQRLGWRRAKPEEHRSQSYENLPAWMNEDAAAPTDEELEFFQHDPELADLTEKLVVEAALADWKERPAVEVKLSKLEGDGRRQMGAIDSLLGAISRLSGLEKSEVAAHLGPRLLVCQARADSDCAANTNALFRIWWEINR